MDKEKRKKLKKIMLVLLALLLAWIGYSYYEHSIIYFLIYNDVDSIIEYIKSFGAFAALVFFLIVVLEVVLAPIPALMLYVVAGILYGGFYGGLLVLAGNLAGAYIDFFIARHFLKNRAEQRIGQRLKAKFDRYFSKYGVIAIIILRINPLTTSDIVSYLAGLTNMRALNFVAATAIGLAPLVFVQTCLGEVITTEYPFLTNLIIIISLVYLIGFILLIFLPARSKRKTEDAQ